LSRENVPDRNPARQRHRKEREDSRCLIQRVVSRQVGVTRQAGPGDFQAKFKKMSIWKIQI
tara:strand:+ start:4078 stop:4260 length:183 start_codon:yes stop_codon:yes gene_type:complete